MKIEEIGYWEAFHSVATQGNFTVAAKTLKISVPLLSKRVARLENELGVRLFTRSTRKVAMTDEGRSLLPRVTATLEELKGLETSFESTQTLSGTIRITSVPFVAHRLLIPIMKQFREAHPKVNFEVELSESMMNLIEGNFDMALRIHDDPKDTSLVYRPLVPNELYLCAAPEYLKKHGSPKRPADLKEHQTLMLDIHRKVSFQNSKQKLGEVAGSNPFSCANGWYLTELALQGLGILVRSRWDVEEHIANGRLFRVLKHFPLESFGQVYAVIPSRKLLAPRVRDFLRTLGEFKR